MTQFVAFLRGVNVGGHCIVKKEALMKAFVSLGFSNVSTFKQSGNVIFETDQNPENIRQTIQQKLNQQLNCEPTVFLRSINQLEELVKHSPFRRTAEEGESFLVTFMADAPPSGFSLPIRIPNSTAEIIHIENHEAYSITRGHGDGGKPNPYIEAKFKTQATTRNLNVLREIIQTYA